MKCDNVIKIYRKSGERSGEICGSFSHKPMLNVVCKLWVESRGEEENSLEDAGVDAFTQWLAKLIETVS